MAAPRARREVIVVRTPLLITMLAMPLDVEAQGDRSTSAWNISLGGGVIVAPRYVGSDEFRTLPMPMMIVTYRNRLFLGPTSDGLGGGLGAHVIRTRRIGLTAELGIQDGRPAERSDALLGTDDRDPLGTLGAAFTVAAGAVRGTVAAAHGLNDGSGWMGTARATVTRPLSRRLYATVEGSAAFADARQLRRDFGISQTEAARRQTLIDAGDRRLGPNDAGVFRPGGGPWNVGASASLMYAMSPRWAVLGMGGLRWLREEVADSPVVRRPRQPWGGLSVMWRR